jgi:hypothetical protein
MHTVFLAVAFAVVLATRTPPSFSVSLLALFALIGASLSLFCLASTVAQLLDQSRPSTEISTFTFWWAKSRPRILAFSESFSVVFLLGCVVILIVAIFRGGG